MFVVGIALLSGVIATPPEFFERVLGAENKVVKNLKEFSITLGLDLAGGTELDYKIDLTDALAQNSDDDPQNDVNIETIAESVRDALERRVNPAGVGEVVVKRSQVEGEEHILVQLPPSTNVAKAKRDAQKDNKLVFYEEDPDREKTTRVKMAAELIKTNASNWEDQKTRLVAEDKAVSIVSVNKRYKDQVFPEELAEKLFAAEEGTIVQEILETQSEAEYTVDESGQMTIKSFPKQVLALAKITKRESVERPKKVEPKAHVRHILFGYPEAKRALDLKGYASVEEAKTESQKIIDNPESVDESERDIKVAEAEVLLERIEAFPYKSKEEAQQKAEEMLARLNTEGTEDFETLAKEFSTEGAAQNSGGDLGEFEPGKMVPAFDKAVFFPVDSSEEPSTSVSPDPADLIQEKPGTPVEGLLSEVVETDFGFHVIEILSYAPGGEETNTEEQISYEMIAWDKDAISWIETELGGAHLENALVGYDQVNQPLVNLYFNSDGADLFAELTGNVASRRCESNPSSLCRLGIKVGGVWVSRATVREKILGQYAQITGGFTYPQAKQLADDLNLGAIDAPVRLSGQTTVEPELGAEQLSKSLKAGMWGLIATMVFMMMGYRLAGVVASVALILYALVFVSLLKTWPASFGGPIVLSLAGMAGIALSIGLAVDGNILIFERMKEEYVRRKNLNHAVDLGFERAWTAIKDSNMTTLITCVILFSLGSSIVKGFAITLIVGTLLSMFTAVTISRNLLRFILLFDCVHRPWLFGITGKFVKKRAATDRVKIRKR